MVALRNCFPSPSWCGCFATKVGVGKSCLGTTVFITIILFACSFGVVRSLQSQHSDFSHCKFDASVNFLSGAPAVPPCSTFIIVCKGYAPAVHVCVCVRESASSEIGS